MGQERPKTELKPLAEDPAQGRPSLQGDLHGGAAGHKTAPRGRSSWSWGFGVSPSPRTHQSAGAGPLVQKSGGPASSRDPDLVTPQGPRAGEGPHWCPAGAKASSRKWCPVQHHRAPPEERSLAREYWRGQALHWHCPRTQPCEVHTEDGSCEQHPGA